jgi:CubicO group peptidase (beta-lactamase class C family)
LSPTAAGAIGGLPARLVPPFAAAGIAWAREGEAARFACAAVPGLAFGPDTLWRGASLSKMAVARTLEGLGGPDVWERDASDALGWPLCHPRHPGVPVTLGMVACHAASLSDGAGYAVPAAVPLRDWLAAQGAGCWLAEPPGARLAYANLGSVILAAAAERLGGDRFDRLAGAHVLGPLGIEGGVAWSGVPPARRRERMAALRRDPDGAFHPQADADVPEEGLYGPLGPPVLPPGGNPSPLSPQGGLRLSLRGALSLAQAAAEPARWTVLPGDPMLTATAPGLIRLDAPPFRGHFANAYGILAGAWRGARGAGAYVLNGLALGDEADGWREEELAILAALADIIA